ncbi:COP9 signalosome complex subunit 1 [Trichinella nativa]|uniref:COP9 signalosome complex subunit 1 n=2 Tax=Trichinella nativa TaxID=6335 RepID=A0A0V1L342_9BILA|nr:COP9 signalosome complex subunit 1 [Trichinella sp. T6]KRZ53717.1 COP9 signalosome complex subunit 1 [Trichinella nativa]
MEYQHMSNGDCVNHEHLPNSLLIDVINENSAGKEVYLERFDLEEYIKVYSGYAELHRLLFIANRCPSLRAQALLLALQKVKLTSNYHLYSVIHGKLTELSKKRSFMGETAITVPPFDADWFEVQKRKAKAKFEKLDQELNVYRCNSIKESIRRGFLYLGEHHLEMGELSKAYKCASKAIQHCCDKTTMLSAQLTFIKLCIYTQRWSEVISVSEAAIATIESENERSRSLMPYLGKLYAAKGIAYLCEGEFKKSAHAFLKVDIENFLFPENDVLKEKMASKCDAEQLEEISKERKLMEENLIVREILQTYIDCQYKKLFSLLDSIRTRLSIDVYIEPHVNSLYMRIRNRSFAQFLYPYSSVSMQTMASTFDTSVEEIERQLILLIEAGYITDRVIDSIDKYIYMRKPDPRHVLSQKADIQLRKLRRLVETTVIRNLIHRTNIAFKSEEPLMDRRRNHCE